MSLYQARSQSSQILKSLHEITLTFTALTPILQNPNPTYMPLLTQFTYKVQKTLN